MAYTKTNWVNDSVPAINASNLNKIEQGIYDNAFESGSNTNGNYIKFNDGTLIQYGMLNKSIFMTTDSYYTTIQGIKFYRSNNPKINFPISFIDTNYNFTFDARTGTNGTSSRVAIPRISDKATTYQEVQLIGLEDFTSGSPAYENLTDVSWQAIGRWK